MWPCDGLDAQSPEMLVDDPTRDIDLIRIERRVRLRTRAAIAEDLGNMRDLAGAFGDAQDEIVLGDARELRSQAPDIADDLGPGERQPARVRLAAQTIGRPCGLVERCRPSIRADPGRLVGVDEIDERVVVDEGPDGRDRVRREHVARVEEPDPAVGPGDHVRRSGERGDDLDVDVGL